MVLLLVDGDFVTAVGPVVFAPLAADRAPVVFFSATLVFEVGAPVELVAVLVAAEVGVLLFLVTAAVVVAGAFLDATPLVGGLEDVPFDKRLWVVLGRVLDVVLPGAEADFPVVLMLGLDFNRALLDGLALRSPEALLLILAARVSLVWSGWAVTASADCCGVSPSTALVAWLGSWTPAGSGSASFSGLDSNVSTGSRAAVTTPSGFISSLCVAVEDLCSRSTELIRLGNYGLATGPQVWSGDAEVWNGERKWLFELDQP